jgi:phosphonate transport system ATP-binding protein
MDIREHGAPVAAAAPPDAAAGARGPSLQLEHASFQHPGARSRAHPALDAVDLWIGGGEHVAVVGPSGAGKTTLLQVAAAALRADSGRVLIDGEDPWRLASGRRQSLRGRLFLAPQIPPLPPRQRVVTAVLAGRLPAMSLASSLCSLLYPLDIAAVHAALAPFDLADRLFDRVDRLSGGERQRVSLARALLAPARLWLLDEPLSALDPVRAARALQTLREQATRRGVTLVVSMHQVEMALANFPRAIGLRDGAVRFDTATSQVSAEQLHQLYAHAGPGPELDEASQEQPVEAAPVAMAWR